MLGAIIGDTIGSVFEIKNNRSKDFPLLTSKSRPTDDSVMTLAVAECIQKKCYNDSKSIINIFKKWGNAFPNCGFGRSFKKWLLADNPEPYYSYGNGAAMRISPVGWYARTEEEVISMSKSITEVTHNHPEGLKGAEVTAMCIYYAKIGKSKEYIKKYAMKHYNIDFTYDELKQNYRFSSACQNTVPQAIYCFLISNSFEDCIRTTISIGGDSDTLAAISGSIAEAYYKHIDADLINNIMLRLKGRGFYDLFEVIYKFNEYKIPHNVSCEEVSDNTIVLGIETFFSNKKELEFLYSKSYNAIAEAFVFHHLDLLIGTDQEDFTKLYYRSHNLDKYIIELCKSFSYSGIYSSINSICGKCKYILDSNYFEDFTIAIKLFNNLFEMNDMAVRLILFENANEAIKYTKNEYLANNDAFKDQLQNIYSIKIAK